MKKLLVAYDGSASADFLLEDLRHAGLPVSMTAVVMSVADVWLPNETATPLYPETRVPSIEVSRREAEEALHDARTLADRAATRLRELCPQWTVESVACADSPGWALVQKAADWKADLVAVGSQGHSVLERFFLGSVSHKVVAEAPCSVHVGRAFGHVAPGPDRMVVAVDGSPDAEVAVQAVAARHWPRGMACHLVTVLDRRTESAVSWSEMFVRRWMRSTDEEVSVGVRRMLEQAATLLSGAGLTVETHLLTGDPKHVLPRQAEKLGARLLFIGAHGLHHRQRFLIGTTASAVAARAHCSVEVIRGA